MSTFEPFKYIARAVVLERDDEGEVIAEHTTEEIHLFSKGQVERWLKLVDELTPNNTQQSNGE